MEENLRLSYSCRIVGADICNQDIASGAVSFLPVRSVSKTLTDYSKDFTHICKGLPMAFNLWG